MTKTEATRQARRALANGHFTVGHADARVRCPGCSRDVLLFGTGGRRPAHGEMVRQLAREIQACEDGHLNLWERPVPAP